jgi:uncharacterized protein YgiM (DUF1202 family)
LCIDVPRHKRKRIRRVGGVFINKRALSVLLVMSICMNPMPISAKTMYTTDSVNIRSRPNTKSKVLDTYGWNKRVKVIETYNDKWMIISYKKKKCYMASEYLCNTKSKYRKYSVSENSGFKSYEDADCLTDNTELPQGKLKKKYKLDKTGVYKVGNRYCIALGSFYSTKIGTKIDLVLKHKGKKKILKCILADCKADKDTNSSGQYHMIDGSVVEFVVNTTNLPKKASYITGDISYAAKKFKGIITEIRVYNRGN